jgi:hypothetical protein
MLAAQVPRRIFGLEKLVTGGKYRIVQAVRCTEILGGIFQKVPAKQRLLLSRI